MSYIWFASSHNCNTRIVLVEALHLHCANPIEGTYIRQKIENKCNSVNLMHRELPLRKGDTVFLLQQLDANWFKGERHGTVGLFPVSYVEVSKYISAAASSIVANGPENTFTGTPSYIIRLRPVYD